MKVFWEKLDEQSEQFQCILQQQEDQLAAEASAANHLKAELSTLRDMVDIQRKQIDKVKEKVSKLSNHLNFYKKTSDEDHEKRKRESLLLDQAVMKVVSDLVLSQQRYKLMKHSNIASAAAKGIFNPQFLDGIAFYEIIHLAKTRLRKHVFSPAEILKQMDL